MGRVEKFFKTFSSQSTVSTYKWALQKFLQSIYGPGELDQQAETYFTGSRNYEDDLRTFFSSIKASPPKTVSLVLAAVRTFLMENDVELPAIFWRRLRGRKKGTRALTLDKVPSNIEFRRILSHMPIHGRALYLALESSGMRIGEALKLNVDDINLDSDPVTIQIRGEYTKTGNRRLAFISTEAKETLEEWLKIRGQYIVSAVGKSHKYAKRSVDTRLFPFENATAYVVWKNALRKARFLEKDPSTNRHTVHPHVLRKFFRTKMGSMIPVDVVEALMGHEGYLTEVYRRYSVEELAMFYKQGEPALLVFTEAQEVAKLRVEIEDRNKQLQTLVNGLTTENLEMKAKVNGLSDRVERLDSMLAAVAERTGLLDVEKLLAEGKLKKGHVSED